MGSKVPAENPTEKFLSTLTPYHVEPLWTVMAAMVPPAPSPKAAVATWKYDEVRPLLLEAGRLVQAEEAERRVLMLINPAMRAPYTTDTIYAGLQLILPGETAPAHRHVAFALRFIVEGERGFTAVDGKKMFMNRGDVILTPSWNWHDHGHDGEFPVQDSTSSSNGPMIWLDGLDLPVYQSFPTNFAQPYSEARYPSKESADIADMKISWKEVQHFLDGQDGPHATYHYEVVKSGVKTALSLTMGAQAERVDRGSESSPVRETCSFVYHCFEGRGSTSLRLANGQTQQVSWSKGDTFAVPAWAERTHRSDEERSYLFAVNDLPLLRNLGMYRMEGRPS